MFPFSSLSADRGADGDETSIEQRVSQGRIAQALDMPPGGGKLAGSHAVFGFIQVPAKHVFRSQEGGLIFGMRTDLGRRLPEPD